MGKVGARDDPTHGHKKKSWKKMVAEFGGSYFICLSSPLAEAVSESVANWGRHNLNRHDQWHFDACSSYTSDPAKEFNPSDVLVAMREYVRHFLGCRDCANHFTNMAAHVEHDVRNGSDGVMWLWRSHNLVNQRLQGDHTEDPDHPKIQWPSQKACPECKQVIRGRYGTSERWREDQVLPYLLEFYSADSIEGGALAVNSATPTTSPYTVTPTTLHGILMSLLLFFHAVHFSC